MLLSLLLAALAPLPAQEEVPSPTLERWEVVGKSDRGEHAIDPETLRRSGDQVRVFVRVRLTAEDGRIILGVVEYRYDCKAKTARRLQASLYEPDGTPRGAVPGNDVDEPIKQGSPSGDVANRVCR